MNLCIVKKLMIHANAQNRNVPCHDNGLYLKYPVTMGKINRNVSCSVAMTMGYDLKYIRLPWERYMVLVSMTMEYIRYIHTYGFL